ncbi:MAG TPA: omptin family outer membrane protease [Treponemataceae bacterium]|jgi:outer membrane protease|nr:omptin family outer membrane protease [Treponemataceae bacterium]
MTPRRLPLALITALLSSPLVALSPPEIALSTGFGAREGVAHEYVYQDGNKISQLDWGMTPIVSLELGATARWRRGFRVSGAVSAGLSGRSGILEDSDFLNQPYSGERTHYSRHDCFSAGSLDLRVEFAWDIALPLRGPGSARRLTVSPSLGFRRYILRWNGRDGYAQYPNDPGSLPAGSYQPWTEDTPKVPMSGRVIEYQQDYSLPSFGFSFSVPIARRWLVSLGATASPIAFCVDRDQHLLTNTEYIDEMTGGIYLEPRGSIRWEPTERVALILEGGWTYLTDLRGAVYTRPISGGPTTRSSAEGGAGMDSKFIRLSVETRLR